MTALVDQMVEHRPNLVRFALKLTRDSVAADDLVQDTFLRAIEKQHQFDPATNLRAWLFTVMYSLFVNGVRTSVRRGQHVNFDDVAPFMTTRETQTDAIAMRDLRRALAVMPRAMVNVLLVAGANGHSMEDSARILGCAMGTIQSRLSRSREILKTLMGESL